MAGWLSEIRRDIHRHPELGYAEERTASAIESRLDELGVPYTRLAGTGVVGLIEGAPGEGGKCVGLRADIDALPLQDAKTGDLSSCIPGVMHACGHDAHAACLLGAARLLQQIRGELAGSVKLIFQPAEESDGGALPMIEAGVMQSPDVSAMFALHCDPTTPVGSVKVTDGFTNAAADMIDLVVTGLGGHGAHPDSTVDVVYVAALVIAELQSVVSRSIDPLSSAVVTIGAIHAGTARNVIPSRVQMLGTIRTLDPDVRHIVHRRVREIVEGVCATHGAGVSLVINRGYPALQNDERATGFVRRIAVETLGGDNVLKGKPSLGAEDFAYFAERVPSCMFNLGTRNEARGIVHPLHSELFDIDESALPVGAGLLATIAAKYLT